MLAGRVADCQYFFCTPGGAGQVKYVADSKNNKAY